MKHKYFILIFSFIVVGEAIGQEVVKRTLVEHFTNTVCSVCASRNPGFYRAKELRPDVLHIAYHPSSPYSGCLFSSQNRAENDARTRYYDVYGGTPTFVINGEIKSSSQVQNADIYKSFDNQTSPLDIDVSLKPSGNDSISVSVNVKASTSHNLSDLTLYVPMIEDTVFYDAPNRENQHYDVFRKSFTGVSSIKIKAPKFGEPPYLFTATLALNQIWNSKRLSAVAIISTPDKKVVQAQQSTLFNPNISSSTTDGTVYTNLKLFPNPSSHFINVKFDAVSLNQKYYIIDLSGRIVLSSYILEMESLIDISSLPIGSYIIKADNFRAAFLKVN